MGDSSTPRILVVDDEEKLANMFSLWLRQDYDVETVNAGDAVLPAVRDEAVDVVLLDRRMPGFSGDGVLRALAEEDLDVRVVMTTGVDPDFDIVDMPFDEYLRKPVQHETLVDAIERQLAVRERDPLVQEYVTVHTKRALLRDTIPYEQRRRDERWESLVDREEELTARLEARGTPPESAVPEGLPGDD